MSAIIQMPQKEQDDPILAPIRQRIAELKSEREKIDLELEPLEALVTKRMFPFAGMRLQDCIRMLLRETEKPWKQDDLIAEAVKRGAAHGNRAPEADVLKSLRVMRDAKEIQISADAKVSFLKK